MPTIKQLEEQGRELARKQLELVNDNTRPWSKRQAEFDSLDADLKAVLDQHRTLKDVERGGFTGLADAGAEGGGQRLGLRAARGPVGARPGWAAEVADRVTKTVGQFGAKAITTGGVDIPTPLGTVADMPVVPARLLDLLINRRAVTTNEFEFLRQTVRTSNAGPVPDDTAKPTSVYTFEDESDRVRVYAHITEPVPERILADHATVEQVIQAQMAEDLFLAIEEDVLVGDGTGEHLTGITATPGIQTQAYDTSNIVTLRKAHTAMVTSGEQPNAWVMSYADLEAIDLLREDGATGGFLADLDTKVFAGLPKVPSLLVPTGTAYLADWNQAELIVRQDARLDADKSGELFTKNQVRLRVEGRFGLALLRPHAFMEVDLAA
jgi:HK97 family phage major capsid protein